MLIGRTGFLQHSSHIFSGRHQRGIAETDAEGFLNLWQINQLITGQPFLEHDERTENAAEAAIASRHAATVTTLAAEVCRSKRSASA